MRDQGSGWRGPDVGVMGDAECANRAKGMLTARGSGGGSDYQPRLQAEAVRSPAWHGWARRLGNLADGSNAEGAVKKGVAGRAIVPGRC